MFEINRRACLWSTIALVVVLCGIAIYNIGVNRHVATECEIQYCEQCIQPAAVVGKSFRGWGVKRNGAGKVPDADPGVEELFAKHNAGYIGDQNQKKIYLTFDEGYENGYTPQILDVLKKKKVSAVFFITKPYLDTEEELVTRMIKEGHYVGNHTVNHPSLPTLSKGKIKEELEGLEKAFYEKYKLKMMFMRPPKGEYNETVLSVADKQGYCTLFWSFAYDDWNKDKIRGPEYAVNAVMDNIHNGAVLLLHAVSKDNADALETIITKLEAAGYTFGDPIDLYKKDFAG